MRAGSGMFFTSCSGLYFEMKASGSPGDLEMRFCREILNGLSLIRVLFVDSFGLSFKVFYGCCASTTLHTGFCNWVARIAGLAIETVILPLIASFDADWVANVARDTAMLRLPSCSMRVKAGKMKCVSNQIFID